jgi:hypothetical protein
MRGLEAREIGWPKATGMQRVRRIAAYVLALQP